MAMLDPQDRLHAALAELWVRMASAFGNRWVSQYGHAPEGVDLAEWGEVIRGLTPRELSTGMQAIRTSGREWPPTAPEFRALCMAIPSMVEVQRELAGAEPVSPFGRLVWQFLDQWRYRHASTDAALRMQQQAYELAVARTLRGDPLPEPVAFIESAPPRPRVPADPAVVRACMGKIAEVLR